MNNHRDKIRNRYDRIAGLYDLMEKPMEKMAVGKWRQVLFHEMKGKVLEIGVGTGKNIEYYHGEMEVTAIDFSQKMLEKAQKRAEALKKKVNLKLMDAQNIQFQDNTFDYVVATCVFCSVPDPVKGFEEIRRVLKPTGKAMLIEHVRSEGSVLGLLMDTMNPLVVNLYGANINRKTEENIKTAGFEKIEITNLWRDIVKKIEISK